MPSVAAPQNKTPYRPIPSHITPLVVDVLFFEKVNRDTPQYRTVPAYNTAHPNAQMWPDHVLCYVEPSDEPGWENWWFVANFTTQGNYNYEVGADLNNRWPSLTQTWIIERSLYTGPGHNTGITAPPALGYTWTRLGDSEGRIGNDKLDSRFVVLKISYEDITQALITQRIDNDSGQIVIVETRRVPVGTAAQKVNSQGYIVEIEPTNTLWSISTKDRVSALMGAGIRSYSVHRPWPWPPVLMNFITLVGGGGDFIFNYSLKSWDDECLIDVREYWSQTAPALAAPTTLGKTSIRWNGELLNINIPECLHPEFTVTETQGGTTVWRTFPATLFVDWPPTVTIFPSVRPHPKGGFSIVEWTVHSPVGVVG